MHSQTIHQTPSRSGRRAFTLPELLTTIAVIGILSAISIQSYAGLQSTARESVARDSLALLNRGVLHFSQSNWEIVRNSAPGATTDELAVLRTLQWRNTTPGSPYVPANFGDATSSSDREFRLAWNGRTFELLAPGTSGSGLLVASTSSTPTSTYTFPNDYQPLGPGQHE